MCHQDANARPLAEFVLSLYNAEYAEPDAYWLCCRNEDTHFDDVLTVMRWCRMAASPGDTFLQNSERIMFALMKRFRLDPDELLEMLDLQSN